MCMGHDKIKHFDDKVVCEKVRLKVSKTELHLIQLHMQRYREAYIQYCIEQLRRVCNGVPMVYPNDWYRNAMNDNSSISIISTRCLRRILEYGFDLLVRNQVKIKDSYRNLNTNQSYKVLKMLKRRYYEYDPGRNEIIIPKQPGMEKNFFCHHEVHIPRIGKIKIVKKDARCIPEDIKFKMIRIQYVNSELYAIITYADNSNQQFDDNGFMKLIRKVFKEDV